MITANGTFTIKSPKGGHRTFRIRIAKRMKGKPRVVELLTGSDNESGYQGFGFVTDGGVRIWPQFKGDGRPSTHEYFGAMLDRLLGGFGSLILEGYAVHGERKCRRCDRKLTTPESIEAGIGPDCATKE